MTKSSKLGRALLFLAAICLIIGGVTRLILGGWHNYMWIPFGLFFAGAIGSVVKDFAYYKGILTMKTTKRGLNMGTLVLLALVLIFALNFLGFRHNKKWDLTEEKLNSIAPQSIKIVQKLDEDLNVYGFFVSNTPQEEQAKQRLKAIVNLYKDETKKIKLHLVDPQIRPDLAEKYEIKNSSTILFDYKGKKTKINTLSEESITNAIVKVTREKNKVIYFLTGHGEVNVNAQEPAGGSGLKDALEKSAYDVKTVNVTVTGALPKDADVLAILGLRTEMLPGEIEAVKKYIAEGGRLLLAGDPQHEGNVDKLMDLLGINFERKFVINPIEARFMGGSPLVALANNYSKTNDVTKDFIQDYNTQFFSAAPLKKKEGTDLTHEEIVKTTESSFLVDGLKKQIRIDPRKNKRGPFAVVMSVKGKLKDPGSKDFEALVYGDAHIFNNQLFKHAFNQNLVTNSFSFLAKDDELVSIAPKKPTGTSLTMSGKQAIVYVVGFLVPLPLLLFSGGTVLWFRRRSA